MGICSVLATEPEKKKEPVKEMREFSYFDMNRPLQKHASDPMNVIKLKPLMLAFQMVSVQYERVIGNNSNMSLASDVNILFYSASLSGSSVTNVTQTITGFGLSPEFRFYPGGNAPRGFFLGPYVTYFGMGIKMEGTGSGGGRATAELTGINAVGGGALIGWKWLIGDVFSIETHVGANYLSMKIPTTVTYKEAGQPDQIDQGPDVNFAGFLPSLNFSLGYAF